MARGRPASGVIALPLIFLLRSASPPALLRSPGRQPHSWPVPFSGRSGPRKLCPARLDGHDHGRRQPCRIAQPALPECSADEIDALVNLLPPRVALLLEDAELRRNLTELVLDEGRPPLARFGCIGGAEQWEQVLTDELLTAAELQTLCTQPLLTTWTADNRACVEGTLHRASRICNLAGKVIGATLRVGRYRFGAVEKIEDLLRQRRSTLLLGVAGAGKTAVLREYARALSDLYGHRVVVIDTFNEIAGGGNTPHATVGFRTRRLMVPDRSRQHEVMMEAVRNHNPEVLIIDEIRSQEDALAAASIAESGISLVAAVQGRSLTDLIENPMLEALVGGLKPDRAGGVAARMQGKAKNVGRDPEAKRRITRPPFQALIELHPRVEKPDAWRLYRDLEDAVDRILLGEQPISELRLPPQHQMAVEGSDAEMEENPDELGLGVTCISLSDANISREAYNTAVQGGTYMLECGTLCDEQSGACSVSAVLTRLIAGGAGRTVVQGQWQLYLPAKSTEEQLTLGATILGLTALCKEWASLQPRPQLVFLLGPAPLRLAALVEARRDLAQPGSGLESAVSEERLLVLHQEVQKLLANVPVPVEILPGRPASRGLAAGKLAQQAIDSGRSTFSVPLEILEALVAPTQTLPDWARAVAMGPKLQPVREEQGQEQQSLLPWQLEENQVEERFISGSRNLEGDALFAVVQRVLRRVRKLRVRTRASYVTSGRTLDVEDMEKLLRKMEELQQEFNGRFPKWERSSGVCRTMQNLESARNKVFGMQGRVLDGGFKVIERLDA